MRRRSTAFVRGGRSRPEHRCKMARLVPQCANPMLAGCLPDPAVHRHANPMATVVYAHPTDENLQVGVGIRCGPDASPEETRGRMYQALRRPGIIALNAAWGLLGLLAYVLDLIVAFRAARYIGLAVGVLLPPITLLIAPFYGVFVQHDWRPLLATTVAFVVGATLRLQKKKQSPGSI